MTFETPKVHPPFVRGEFRAREDRGGRAWANEAHARRGRRPRRASLTSYDYIHHLVSWSVEGGVSGGVSVRFRPGVLFGGVQGGLSVNLSSNWRLEHAWATCCPSGGPNIVTKMFINEKLMFLKYSKTHFVKGRGILVDRF